MIDQIKKKITDKFGNLAGVDTQILKKYKPTVDMIRSAVD
jgi:hypothetical protein